MNKELEKELIQKYPNLFRGTTKSPKVSLMCFGCECHDGWFDLIKETCEKLKHYTDVEFLQIKEKFGGLRLYVGAAPDEVHNIVEEAENQSYHVCELCGKPGETRPGGWIMTLCDYCFEQKRVKKKDADKIDSVGESN